MFSRTSVKKSFNSITQIYTNQEKLCTRQFFNQSKGSVSASSSLRPSFDGSSYGHDQENGDAFFKLLLRSVSSGVLIIGSGLGLGYWYHSLADKNSLVSFAEAANGTVWRSNEDLLLPKKKHRFLFGDAFRRRVFFKYEKRIRTQSPPEKVFEYFASLRTPSGDILMTPADLMRAIVPVFPSSESDRVREGFLRGERVPSELHCEPSQFFMLFDTNNDGLISFPEYIFFVTLLSIPETSFSVAFKMFDQNNNGAIDREEFKKVMSLMRAQNRQGACHRDGRRLGFRGMEPVENAGLLEYFFGKDGNKCLQHGRFVQFLRDLHDEILRLEFAHYDFKSRGTISAKDFALSMVAAADITHINKLLDRVEELNNEPNLRDIRITMEEFRDFAELRKQLRSLSLAIFSYGKVNGMLTKIDFQRAASQVCGISITDNLVDIIFHVFDADRDGNLSSDEFIRVLERRQKDISLPRDAGFKNLISCCATCAKANSLIY
ncbi:calcium uptake protein, mitochondrial-like [Jatropha curcas]|uniref:calcium uptake protein, mitochondrial-like n=1 Tax=Jatropha curcas TaxID=180498 RepID=UPI0009D74E20|nr:calcium uptake protein, mitochondrial-like [Jatropha curcas]